MSTDPTAERIDAVAWAVCGVKGSPYMDRNAAERILTSTDPAVHTALAASLPAEVKAASMTDAEMLAALVDRGTLTEVTRWDYMKRLYVRQFITPWEVAP